jgi:hypothetical protein
MYMPREGKILGKESVDSYSIIGKESVDSCSKFALIMRWPLVKEVHLHRCACCAPNIAAK